MSASEGENMKIRQINYSRKFNLGNYESEEIGLLADLDAAEDLDEAFKSLKAQVFRLHEEGGLLEKAKAMVEIEDVTGSFPGDLRGLLMFEVDEEYVKIQPRQYLGSENFGKVAAIVRDQLKGEYISAGKESHWRVRRSPEKRREEPEISPRIPDFDPEDFMKHAWKGKKIGDKEYGRGSLSWGWDFKSEFQDATILALDKGPITIENYEFTVTDRLVQTRKVKN